MVGLGAFESMLSSLQFCDVLLLSKMPTKSLLPNEDVEGMDLPEL